ncbi:MAG TPA: hypothetical protein VF247_00250 [Candidatus Krumholzibacteria bacterium]
MKRTITLVTLVAYCLCLGCSTVREIPVSEARSSERVAAVTDRSGRVIEFVDDGGLVNSYRGTIDGTTTLGVVVSIPIDSVATVRAERTNTGKTVAWTVVGVGLAVTLLAILMHDSLEF